MNIDEIKRLSKAERIQVMEALWDSMLYDDEKVETPEWHELILEQRKQSIADGTAKFISISELKASRGK
jgi:putative addiction module component (TIGR02574 family)